MYSLFTKLTMRKNIYVKEDLIQYIKKLKSIKPNMSFSQLIDYLVRKEVTYLDKYNNVTNVTVVDNNNSLKITTVSKEEQERIDNEIELLRKERQKKKERGNK